MGATADDLRSQVNQQRDGLSRDMEALGDRISPGRIASPQGRRRPDLDRRP
jgi:Protein of unknown function (DUF3618)